MIAIPGSAWKLPADGSVWVVDTVAYDGKRAIGFLLKSGPFSQWIRPDSDGHPRGFEEVTP